VPGFQTLRYATKFQASPSRYFPGVETPGECTASLSVVAHPVTHQIRSALPSMMTSHTERFNDIAVVSAQTPLASICRTSCCTTSFTTDPRQIGGLRQIHSRATRQDAAHLDVDDLLFNKSTTNRSSGVWT